MKNDLRMEFDEILEHEMRSRNLGHDVPPHWVALIVLILIFLAGGTLGWVARALWHMVVN